MPSSRRTRSSKSTPPPKKPSLIERLKGLHVRLVRKGLNLHVELESADDRKRAAKEVSTAASVAEAAPMRLALSEVLNRHASSRTVLVHLGMLEKALGKRGMKVFGEMPPEMLRKSMDQLDTLVASGSSAPLAALRAKLSTALVAKVKAMPRDPNKSLSSQFDEEQKLLVGEASESKFHEANAEWERSFTGRPVAPPPSVR